MSLARDDTGNIRDLHSTASGLSRNFRDASGATGGTPPWRRQPTPIQAPGKGLGSNPYSRRMTNSDARQVDGRGGKAGSSSALKASSSRQAPKRRKLDFSLGIENSVTSIFFQQRGTQAIPSTSSSSSRPTHPTANAIIIDAEDDTPAADDDRHEPIVLRTSSPDPMDVIGGGEASYIFDQNKPSPIHAYGASLEEKRKPPQDGESTLRVRNTMKEVEARTTESVSRPDADADDVRPADAYLALLSRRESAAQAEAPSAQGNVKKKVALFEQSNRDIPRHVDLKAMNSQSRKNGMKPRQPRRDEPRRDIPPLPLQQQLDPDATRSSGFVSGTKASKGKATGFSIRLPLKEWSIGATIPSQDATPELHASLAWDSGFLKVRDADGSIPFKLQVKKGSIDNVKYVDIKKSPTSEPLIQIHPSVMASVPNCTTFSFKPGSTDPDGLLTFKFDTSASGWDNEDYMGIVRQLVELVVVKNGKSILDGPAARAVWEAVTRVSEDMPMMSDPEPMILDIPEEKPPSSPPKPRSRLKPRSSGNASIETYVVRRSARLSGVEEKRFSPKPDPDEVILGYRSGTGSFNITNGDVGRLKPGEFLNDTLIEFGLKLWLADLQGSNPELASQVHVFSSFFYKKLSTKIPEEGYNSVKKWTSKFDIFQKKYIIVPINENLHWYLAIIYLPEYTLLPPPVQHTSAHPRRSTRRLGLVIDSSDPPEPEPAPRQSLPPDSGPPPNGRADSVPLVDPETPRTDDQRSEIDVERMVESALTPVEPTPKPVDGQDQVGTPNTDALVTRYAESPSLEYPQSSPPCHPVTLLSSDPLGDGTEQSNNVTSAGGSNGDTVLTSGIPPSTFYGTRPQGRGDVTPPQIAPVDATALVPDIEIEDETVGNPDSEPEEVAEHPRTYIYTFDSLASKHPQAVKRLSRYLLMEAHDKKQRDEDTLTEPKGMQAIVPAQPNYCDCGIYLLHFAKTFMKDPKLSSDIIRSRTSPQKGRRVVPHEHWDGASVGSYREELAARIHAMSEEWKKQRGEQDSSGTKNQQQQADGAAAPQEQQEQQQPRGDPPAPTVSSKAENDDFDSDIEVVGSHHKPSLSKASRRDSGLTESKRGPAARVRG